MLDRRDERVGAALGVDTLGHVDVGQPREQLLQQDPDLGAGQVRAEAEVRTGAEREVQVRRAVDVERVGVVEHVGVAVRARVHVEHDVARAQRAAAQLGVAR